MIPRKFTDWDRINITLELQNKISLWWKNQDIENMDNIPFKRGVICCKDALRFKEGESYDIYLAFELQETHIDMYEIYSIDGRIVKKWDLLYDGTTIDGHKNFLLSFTDDLEIHKSRMTDLTVIFIAIINFIVYYKEDVKVLRTKSTIRTPPKKKKTKSSKSVIYIPTKTYTILNVPTTENVRKQIERKTEAWEVRGHLRKYKNGKVIWIKPYFKGDKSKIKTKTYQITDFNGG